MDERDGFTNRYLRSEGTVYLITEEQRESKKKFGIKYNKL